MKGTNWQVWVFAEAKKVCFILSVYLGSDNPKTALYQG
jgi:hypothetical protein